MATPPSKPLSEPPPAPSSATPSAPPSTPPSAPPSASPSAPRPAPPSASRSVPPSAPLLAPPETPKRNSKKLPQFIAGFSAAGGAFAAGVAFGWSSPVYHEIVCDNGYGFPVSDAQFSWVSSAVLLGAASISIPIGFMINITGRKLTMLLVAIPLAIGWIIMIFAQNVLMMCAGRFLLGIAGGAFCVIVPLYTTEIAIIEIRGTVGNFFQLLFGVGVLLAYILGAIVNVFTFNIIVGVVSVVFVVLFGFMPESPTFLVAKDKDEQLEKTLHWLRGKNYDITSELFEIRSAHSNIKENPMPMLSALCRPTTRKALFLSLSLMVIMQMTGMNAIIFYSTTIFTEGKSGFSEKLTTILLGTIMVVCIIFSTFIIDRIERRTLILVSAVVESFTTLALGVYFLMKEWEARFVESINWLPIVSVCLSLSMISIGVAPVAWLFMAEVFTSDVKSIAASIVTTTNWCCAFLITNTFLVIKNKIGLGCTFFIFTAITLFGAIFIFYLVPETKGRSSYIIQKSLSGIVDKPVRVSQRSTNRQSKHKIAVDESERHEEDVEEIF